MVAIFATPSPTVKTYATMKALNYKPEQVILNSVSANDYVMGLALANSNAATLDGSISTAYLLNSNDPKYANNAFVKLYKAQMAKWAPNADPNNTFYYYGFAKAYDVVKLLAGDGQEPDPREASQRRPAHELDEPGHADGRQGDDQLDRTRSRSRR